MVSGAQQVAPGPQFGHRWFPVGWQRQLPTVARARSPVCRLFSPRLGVVVLPPGYLDEEEEEEEEEEDTTAAS
ncbi:hypothetical protein EYF80_059562 [Liparis tanakae]|uniref:Uncharacterized protein n=1 Tax=Liparis tanakae TaxID=230148 RepID=A0A4Z2EN20_9TELE|nr:hypothetical protein EYF80_059562 [Liparis tanakae]